MQRREGRMEMREEEVCSVLLEQVAHFDDGNPLPGEDLPRENCGVFKVVWMRRRDRQER